MSSARSSLTLKGGETLIVGGRVNAADDEALRRALSSGEEGAVRQACRDQEKEGAAILRLKVGAPGLDEQAILGTILGQLSPTTRAPLLIDCDGLGAAATALRGYPGCPLLSAEREPWGDVCAAARRHGAVPVLRCAPGGGLQSGRGTVRAIIAAARQQGFTRGGIVIDVTAGGTLPEPETIQTALDLISWCSGSVGCRTLFDLTAIGRGLPERQWLQAALLAAAQAAGLTLAVVDPAFRELTNIRAAGNLLAGYDRDAVAWRARFG